VRSAQEMCFALCRKHFKPPGFETALAALMRIVFFIMPIHIVERIQKNGLSNSQTTLQFGLLKRRL